MRCIIAGSRSITDPRQVAAAVAASGFDITEVVSGTARGADQLGELFAEEHGIPVRRFLADWNRYGKRAGMLRNLAMLECAAAAPEGGGLIAVWDGRSPGTRHTIEHARKAGLPVYVYFPDQHPAGSYDLMYAYWLMKRTGRARVAV